MLESYLVQQILIPLILTVITGLISWGGVELTKWVRTKTKNECVTALVQHVTSLAEGAVQQVEMRYKPTLPSHYLDQIGKLNPDGQQAAQREACRLIRNQLPRSALKTAKHLIPDMDAFIGNQIERVIAAGKRG